MAQQWTRWLLSLCNLLRREAVSAGADRDVQTIDALVSAVNIVTVGMGRPTATFEGFAHQTRDSPYRRGGAPRRRRRLLPASQKRK